MRGGAAQSLSRAHRRGTPAAAETLLRRPSTLERDSAASQSRCRSETGGDPSGVSLQRSLVTV